MYSNRFLNVMTDLAFFRFAWLYTKGILLFFCLLVWVLPVLGQVRYLHFEQDSVHLGRIKLENAPFRVEFRFRATATFPVAIESVVPDCACTVANYSKVPFYNGQRGEIFVEFHPYRPGPFVKTFLVRLLKSDDMPGPPSLITLKITGYVEPYAHPPHLEFPMSFGGLRLKNRIINLGVIGHKDIIRKVVEVYNHSEQAITFADSVVSVPPHIQVLFEDGHTIRPKETGSFVLFYHPELKNDTGYLQDSLVLASDDPKMPLLKLNLTTTIQPQRTIDQLSTLPAIPRIVVRESEIDLGTVTPADDPMVSILIINEGGADLLISRLQPDEPFEILSLEGYKINPTQGATLNLRLRTKELKGSRTYQVLIHTNDPVKPVYKVMVKATVEK